MFRSAEPVTLIGGGVVGRGDLDAALARAPRLVAADGGAIAALKAGHMPEAVIGDFDSLPAETMAALDPAALHRDPDQDTTDFEKCLARIDAPAILGVGFTGGRVDHTLAVFNALVRHSGACVVIGTDDVVLHLRAAIALDIPQGTRVSLFPMMPVTGRSVGLEWPIDSLAFSPGGQIGTSNRATGPVRIAPDGPGLLLILPRACLDAVLAAIGH